MKKILVFILLILWTFLLSAQNPASFSKVTCPLYKIPALSSPPSPTTDYLYRIGTHIYWQGIQVDVAGAWPGFGTTHATAAYGDHLHTGTYEPVIAKSTGFLKWTGAAWAWDNSTYVTGTPWTLMGYLTSESDPLSFHKADSNTMGNAVTLSYFNSYSTDTTGAYFALQPWVKQNYVPYAGATKNIDLNSKDIKNINAVIFKQIPDTVTFWRQLYWDNANGTLAINLDTTGGNKVTLQIGQEQFMWMVNDSSVTVPNGTVVRCVGEHGNRPKIGYAIANQFRIPMGVATQDILAHQNGLVTTMGVVNGFNTSGYAAGTLLYLSSTVPGGMTDTVPSPPNFVSIIGRTLDSQVNGSIFVFPRYPIALDTTLHGANASNLYSVSEKAVKDYIDETTANSAAWDDADTLWRTTGWYGFTDNTKSTGLFTAIDSSFTLTNLGGAQYIRNGVICNIPPVQKVPITGSSSGKGTYYFYIDDNVGTVVCGSAWTLKDSKVPVACIVWDKSNPGGFTHFGADERHGGTTYGMMPRRTHYYLHSTIGTRYQSGLRISGETVLPGSASSANNQFKISEGEIDDEDLDVVIPVKGKPLTATHPWTLFYRTSSTTWAWDTTAVPYPFSATYIRYDASGTMTTSQNNRYVNSYLLATNFADSARFIIIPGRGEFTTAAAAQAEDPTTFDWTGFPIAESVILYRLTWFTGVAFTGALGRVKLNNTPMTVNRGIVTGGSSTPANGWTVSGNDILQSTSGNVGIGIASTPRYSVSIVKAAGGLNITDPNYNLIRSDSVQAADTSSTKFQIVSGKPTFSMRDNNGLEVLSLDGTAYMRLKGNLDIDSSVVAGYYDNGNSSTAITIYASKGNYQKVTRTGSCTYTISGMKAGQVLTLQMVHENSATAYTVTFSPTVLYAGGTAPTYTNTANAVDIISIRYDGSAYYGVQSADFK